MNIFSIIHITVKWKQFHPNIIDSGKSSLFAQQLQREIFTIARMLPSYGDHNLRNFLTKIKFAMFHLFHY